MKLPTVLLLIAAGCAAPPAPTAPEDLSFARAYLAQPAAETREAARERPALPARPAPDPLAGILAIPAALPAPDGALTEDQLAALAVRRGPAVAAARDGYEAARTAYAQAADLKDLVAIYRAFVRETDTRVGPEKSRRPTEAIAPHPNLDALSAAVVERTVAIAFERWRAAIRDTVAAAIRAHADAARLAAARRIVADDVALHERLVAVVRARFEAGRGDQAGVLAFEARRDELRAELDVLDRQATAIRARWNRLLHRPETAAVTLDVPQGDPGAVPATPDGRARPELRIAVLAAERAAAAVRLAETMTLPRMDLGSSRLEHERAADKFPGPGRMVKPRADFGVKEAQVGEMRARAAAAAKSAAAWRDRTAAEIREALYMFEAARRRFLARSTEIVPKADRSYRSERASYEAGRRGYIELLDSARRLLRARLGLVDARRDAAHARARLLETAGRRIG